MLPKLLLLSLVLTVTACHTHEVEPDAAPPERTAGTPGEEPKAIQNAPFVDGQLIVRFQDGLGADQIIGLISRNGDVVLRYEIGSGGATLIEINSGRSVLDAAHLYSEMPEVRYAEPNYVREERGDN
jgi:fervidolysin-like protein